MSFINFARYVGKLKKVKRTGWIAAGVKRAESVAEHSFRTAFLTMILSKKSGLDQSKLLKMAIVHDLAEALTGDLVMEKGKKKVRSRKERTKLDEEALKEIFAEIDNGQEYFTLWQEANERQTKEAKFLKQVDKLEMLIQALEYEGETKPGKLDEFWENTEMHLEDKEFKKFFQELVEERKSILSD